MERKKRKVARGWHDQLLTLLNGWDPVGLLDAGAARDEYECIVPKLLSLLTRQASEDEVARFLEAEISDHFGRSPRGAAQFATKAVRWFAIASAETPS